MDTPNYTVAQLIAMLRLAPPDALVLLADRHGSKIAGSFTMYNCDVSPLVEEKGEQRKAIILVPQQMTEA